MKYGTVKTPVLAQHNELREKLNNFLTAYRNENLKTYSERANKTQFGNEATIITSVVNMVKIDFEKVSKTAVSRGTPVLAQLKTPFFRFTNAFFIIKCISNEQQSSFALV